jgi:hypothetical protein
MQEKEGETIACDHNKCSIVWFHFSGSLIFYKEVNYPDVLLIELNDLKAAAPC